MKHYPLFSLFLFTLIGSITFKIRDRHKLELLTSKAMKLFGNSKEITDKTKKWR